MEDVATHLLDHGLTVGTVESATGGLISSLLTDVPGSSHFYNGSVVAYSNDVKVRVVGVKQSTLETHGAVSAEVAEEMASGGRGLLGVDICISDTGIAGPGGGSRDKPVGLFYLGLSYKGGTYSRRFVVQGDRTINRKSTAEAALRWLDEMLTGRWTPGLS